MTTDTPPTSDPPPVAARRRAHHDGRTALLFTAPALVVLAAFTFLPVLAVGVASLFEVPLAGGGWNFVGAENYREVLGDDSVRAAAWHTVVYCAMTIVPSLAIGLGLALVVDRLGRLSTLASTLLFLPLTANLVAMAVVFRQMFAYRGGLANEALAAIGVGPVNFLGEASSALPTLAAVGVWRTSSFTMVIFLAGLTAIPTAIHEAAAMDGVRGLAKLRLVVVPMLRPTLVLATVLATLQAVQVFDTIEVMTDGKPLGATETILTITWRTGFQYFELGQAAALSLALVTVLLLIGWFQRRALVGDEHR